jgi:hypothetical protein
VTVAGCGSGDAVLFFDPEQTPQRIELTARALDDRSAALAWTSAGSGLAYRIERNGAAVGTTSALEALERGLEAGQRYCWRVLAYGGLGWQARSNEACVGTDPGQAGWRVERQAGGRWPALAIGANGDLHLCFATAVGASTGAGIAYLRVGPGREPETIDADGVGRCSIAVDAAGVVHVAYLSRFGLRHATRATDGWRPSTVDAQALVGITRTDGPALALAADGAPRIAYRRLADGGSAAIALAERVPAGWRFDLSGIRALVGPRSLAVDADGASRLATVDELGQAAIAWRRASAGWVRQASISLAPSRGDGPPIDVAPDGSARIVAWQRTAPTTDDAVSLRWTETVAGGASSETIVASTRLGGGLAIAVAEGVARVAAVDIDGAVRVFTRGASAWTGETVPEQGGAAATLDFAVGPDGQLRVVFDRIAEGGVVLASRTP